MGLAARRVQHGDEPGQRVRADADSVARPSAVVARVAVARCLPSGGALLPVIFRLAERRDRSGSAPPAAGATAWEEDESWVGDF
jgi:hypothetical protein